MTYPTRRRGARSCACACRSEPPPGSVSAIVARSSPVAIFGRYRCFCSSVPKSSSSLATTVWPPIAPGQAHPAASQLLGDQRVAGRADLRLAPRLRDGQAEDAQLLHLLDELLRVGVGVLELAHHRLDVAVDELAHQLDDRALFLGQLVHACPFAASAGLSRSPGAGPRRSARSTPRGPARGPRGPGQPGSRRSSPGAGRRWRPAGDPGGNCWLICATPPLAVCSSATSSPSSSQVPPGSHLDLDQPGQAARGGPAYRVVGETGEARVTVQQRGGRGVLQAELALQPGVRRVMDERRQRALRGAEHDAAHLGRVQRPGLGQLPQRADRALQRVAARVDLDRQAAGNRGPGQVDRARVPADQGHPLVQGGRVGLRAGRGQPWQPGYRYPPRTRPGGTWRRCRTPAAPRPRRAPPGPWRWRSAPGPGPARLPHPPPRPARQRCRWRASPRSSAASPAPGRAGPSPRPRRGRPGRPPPARERSARRPR